MAGPRIVALRPQHWQLLIVGAAHGSPAIAGSLRRLLDAFQPAVVFLELDRRTLALFDPPAGAPSEAASVRAATAAGDAAPECAEVVRWAVSRRVGGPLHSAAIKAAACPLVPIDRDQLNTRRRLTTRLAVQPMQVLRAHHYWGSMPDTADIDEWCNNLSRDCPAIHGVVLEERDEFMSYRILQHLEARLAAAAGPWRQPALGAAGGQGHAGEGHAGEGHAGGRPAEWLPHALRSRAAAESKRIAAALRWSLEGPACGEGGLRLQPAFAGLSRCGPPPEERLLVLCGPAHVDGLARHLAAGLGEGATAAACEGQFLARNAALFPRLLANADWPWVGLRSSEPNEAQLAAFAKDVLTGEDSRTAPELPSRGRAQDLRNRRQAAPLQTVFVHERMRDLSRTPLPVWPVLALAYIVCPFLIFIVIPARVDLYWLQGRIRGL